MAKRKQADAALERQIAARAVIRMIERNPRAFVVFRRMQLVALRERA